MVNSYFPNGISAMMWVFLQIFHSSYGLEAKVKEPSQGIGQASEPPISLIPPELDFDGESEAPYSEEAQAPEGYPSNQIIDVSMTDRPGYYAVFDRSIHRAFLPIRMTGGESTSGGNPGGNKGGNGGNGNPPPGNAAEKKKQSTPNQDQESLFQAYFENLQDRHSGLIR